MNILIAENKESNIAEINEIQNELLIEMNQKITDLKEKMQEIKQLDKQQTSEPTPSSSNTMPTIVNDVSLLVKSNLKKNLVEEKKENLVEVVEETLKRKVVEEEEDVQGVESVSKVAKV